MIVFYQSVAGRRPTDRSANVLDGSAVVQVDDLVDVIEGNRIYIPALYILNKIDQITLEELEVIDRMENYVPICAYHEWNLDGVLESVWDKLDLTRCGLPTQLRRQGVCGSARVRGTRACVAGAG